MVGVVLGTNEREVAGCSGLRENHRRKHSMGRGDSVIYSLCFMVTMLQLIYIHHHLLFPSFFGLSVFHHLPMISVVRNRQQR